MEEFIKDFWVEIIFFCIAGLIVLLKILKTMAEKDAEIKDAFEKNNLEAKKQTTIHSKQL